MPFAGVRHSPMALVSIILPTHDRPALFPRALSSVLCEQRYEIEVVVVDNNVATPPIDGPQLRDPRVRIVRCATAKNASMARNAGLDTARGEWVTYLDDDDEYAPGKIDQQLDLALSSGSPMVLCGAEVCLNRRRRFMQCGKNAYSGDELLNEATLGAPLTLHRNEQSLRFNEAMSAGEDALFAQTMMRHWNVSRVPVVPKPLVVVHQEGPSRPRTNLQAQASWRAARQLWWDFGRRYSTEARHMFVLRAIIAREKSLRRPANCLCAACRLLRVGGSGQLRYVVNALIVSAGLDRGRLVT